jgi:hypothetical protein
MSVKDNKQTSVTPSDFAVPSNAIRGTLKMTAKAGETNKKGLVRKQNMFEASFGGIAISASAYAHPEALKDVEYDVILVPKSQA